MNDLKTLKNGIELSKTGISKPASLSSDKQLYDEYAHRPYTNPAVASVETPIPTAIDIPTTLAIGVGETKPLTHSFTPTNGRGRITYSSSTSKATVDKLGNVTGVEAGSSIITATCAGKSDTCTVTVS